MKVLLLTMALTLVGACSTPKEKLAQHRAEAKEEYQQNLKQAQEEYQEDEKEEAVEMIEDSDGVQYNKDEGSIRVDD